MNAVRAPAFALLLALLVGAFIFAEGVEKSATRDYSIPAVSELSPLDGPADIWFCIGPTSALSEIADRVLGLTNLSDEMVEGRITVVDEIGNRVDRTYQVDGGDVFEFRPDPFVPEGQFAAVTVESPSGGIYVDQRIVGEVFSGRDYEPCVTTTSTVWRHPWSSTERPERSAVLLLHNPFPGTAVADIRFISDVGRHKSLDSQGVVIAGRSLVAYDLTERVADSEVVSTLVDVRSGQLVSNLFQLSKEPVSSILQGLDNSVGSPRDSDRLFLPGVLAEAAPESGKFFEENGEGEPVALLVVLNSGGTSEEVEVVPWMLDGDNVEPFRLTLRSGQREVVNLFGDGRLAAGSSFFLEVRSLGASSMSAALVTGMRSLETDELETGSGLGFDVLSAVDYAATKWWLRAARSEVDEFNTMVVLNPAKEGIASIELTPVFPIPQESTETSRLPRYFELDPGRQVEVIMSTGVVELSASMPVIVLSQSEGPLGKTVALGVGKVGTVVRPS